MTRRSLRESIFKILFRYEFNSETEMDDQIEYAIEAMSVDDEDDDFLAVPARKSDKLYIVQKTKDILNHIEEIDKTIESVSDGWKLSRIGKAELAILRLGVYEIKFDDDVPDKVAINEALELSKIYCNPDAKAFINALLNALL